MTSSQMFPHMLTKIELLTINSRRSCEYRNLCSNFKNSLGIPAVFFEKVNTFMCLMISKNIIFKYLKIIFHRSDKQFVSVKLVINCADVLQSQQQATLRKTLHFPSIGSFFLSSSGTTVWLGRRRERQKRKGESPGTWLFMELRQHMLGN